MPERSDPSFFSVPLPMLMLMLNPPLISDFWFRCLIMLLLASFPVSLTRLTVSNFFPPCRTHFCFQLFILFVVHGRFTAVNEIRFQSQDHKMTVRV